MSLGKAAPVHEKSLRNQNLELFMGFMTCHDAGAEPWTSGWVSSFQSVASVQTMKIQPSKSRNKNMRTIRRSKDSNRYTPTAINQICDPRVLHKIQSAASPKSGSQRDKAKLIQAFFFRITFVVVWKFISKTTKGRTFSPRLFSHFIKHRGKAALAPDFQTELFP